jgi:hypothetical protein
VPLPKTPVNIQYLDKDSTVVEGTFMRRETGYQPTPDYYPTMRAVKCGQKGCGEIGVLEFLGGLNLKEADRVMEGKPIRGTCMKCRKQVDLIPLPVDKDGNPTDMKVYALIQELLLEKVRQGKKLDPTGLVVPKEVRRRWEGQSDGAEA